MHAVPDDSISRSLYARAVQVAPGGVHSPVRSFRAVGGVPRFIQSARNATLLDVDGNAYTDYCMAWGPLLFGHRDPEVHEAVREALDRGWSFGAAEATSLELAELITSQLPWVGKVRFVNSGTEAVMSALRVARAATGRSRIVKFDGCYHGHVDSMLVRAGSGLADMASPDSAGVPSHVASDTLVLPLNNPTAIRHAFERFGPEIAAVIVEPLPCNCGLLPQTDEFLHTLFTTARAHGALVIFDEVISGFRVRFGGMAELTGLHPDLVTYGKVVGGGFPVGAYGGRSDLMDLVAPTGAVYQAGTLSANPVAMTAGLTTLRKLLRVQPYDALANGVEAVAAEIEEIPGQPPITVQRCASLFWMILGEITTADGVVRTPKDIPPLHSKTYPRLFHHLLSRKIYLAPSGHEVAFLSTAHTAETLQELADAVAEFRRP